MTNSRQLDSPRPVPPLLTAREAADILRVSVHTLWRWVREDQVPVVRLPPGPSGRSALRFDAAALEQWTASTLLPITVQTGGTCVCGKRLPWHLMDMGLTSHNCYCERVWTPKEDGTEATWDGTFNKWRTSAPPGPTMVVTVEGPQGCGKSTLLDALTDAGYIVEHVEVLLGDREIAKVRLAPR